MHELPFASKTIEAIYLSKLEGHVETNQNNELK